MKPNRTFTSYAHTFCLHAWLKNRWRRGDTENRRSVPLGFKSPGLIYARQLFHEEICPIRVQVFRSPLYKTIVPSGDLSHQGSSIQVSFIQENCSIMRSVPSGFKSPGLIYKRQLFHQEICPIRVQVSRSHIQEIRPNRSHLSYKRTHSVELNPRKCLECSKLCL